ncbi:MAG: bifunctional salicylyl-CoA 5-hydroxylase/oxidoreductase [Candidatus Odyssella sp.]|nr:bifunctional salicylyl-CoA 5-hydroxylase/oxidoreductase [Candidatus Odyssella sp.]
MNIVVIGGGPGGLYFAILMKKARPDARVTVYERNRPDDTFGFGVVFSDETLGNFLSHDPESYDAITRTFAYWDDIDFRWKGEVIRTGGHGFCGCGRVELLKLLHARAAQLGVELRFQTEIADIAALARSADLVVGADGVNSRVRETFKDTFRPEIEWRRNKFIWLGSTKPCPAFTFHFTENRHGTWVLGEYQYNDRLATWIIEAPEETWASAKGEVEHLSEPEILAYMENLWADYLGGHKLVANKSIWRTFPTIRCGRWHHENVVLIGDALHTAHYSIGSGTKLAMEDAIVLVQALAEMPAERASVPAALARFEQLRREEVEKTQHAADVSVIWTENPRRYRHMPAWQATFSMLTRSKQITYDNLRARDAKFVENVDRWFADTVRAKGFNLDGDPPPMFTPFRLRDLTLANRVVVSPMDLYSAEDGTVGDFHFVHFGALAHGGAGLIFSEMTCVSREGRITPGCGGLYKPEHVAAWKRIVDYVHANSDAKFAIQIGHGGRKGSTKVAWEGMDRPLDSGNWEVIGPSPVKHYPFMQTPRAMTRDDMIRVRDDFVAAARMADAAGADMLELHMAHGYLLSNFITPVANRRTDEYGGSLANRMRFPLEVFDAVRAAWPRHKPISARISATDWVGKDGITPEQSVEIARMLKAHGCDAIDVSAGQTTPDAKPVYGRMFQTPFSEQIRNEADIATFAVGNITTWDQVNTIVAAGRADLVCLARPHLVNPHFTLQAAAYYGYAPQRWPKQYESGKDQAMRLMPRDRAEIAALRVAAKPPSHRPRSRAAE